MYGPGDTFTSSVNPTGILVVKFSVLAGGRPRHSANHVEDSSKVGTRASNEHLRSSKSHNHGEGPYNYNREAAG